MGKDVHLFEMLPARLLRSLREESRIPVLTAHPFFSDLVFVQVGIMQLVCCDAVTEMVSGPRIVVFSRDDVATSMHFIDRGVLCYLHRHKSEGYGRTTSDTQSPRTTFGFETEVDIQNVRLEDHQWTSEAALWTAWIHTGELVTMSDSLLLSIGVHQ